MQPLLSLAAPVVATATLLLIQTLIGQAQGSPQFAPLPLQWQQIIIAWISICAALLGGAGWRAATGGSWSSTLRLRKVHPLVLVCALLAGAALWILVQWVVASQRMFIPAATLDRWDSDMFEHAQNAFAMLQWDTPVALGTSLLVGAIAPAFAEELMCRGLLVESAVQSGVPSAAIVIFTSIIFAVIHTSLPMALPMTVLGCGLGLLSLRSGSVLPAIVAHATFNTITVLLLRSTRSMVPVYSLNLFLLALLSVAVLALLFFIVRRFSPRPSTATTG